ncbi:MAG: ATP-binding protein [Ramlibacter sp.]|nr:ATP-binding protein [Ramlibacter sp.]
MPYQLRRIVAINIKNSITRLPTGRVAELDPRGGVLAIGENGVGKTTFLRLYPFSMERPPLKFAWKWT